MHKNKNYFHNNVMEVIKINNEIDMGSMTAKEIGDLMSKTLVERGKEVANKIYPNTDYGDLPSKTLTELGKEALSPNNN